MLEALKRVIKAKGVTYVASQMGYRSVSTINKWVNGGAIPASAQETVKVFLASEKALAGGLK